MRSYLVILLVLAVLAFTGCDPPVVVPPPGDGPGGGQFLIQCKEPVRSARFDPIVYPRQQVAGHMHEFYGNRTINPDSDWFSLVGAATACEETGDTAGYWHPTLYSNGVRRVAPKSTFYYDSPLDGPVHSYPDGLKMIAGDANATTPQGTGIVYWGCGSGSGQSKLASPPQCDGGDFTLHVIFPDCWNGTTLDSPTHKSHVAYSNDGRCPGTHPVELPRLTMRIQWNDWRPNPNTLSLSSGSVHSMHADFLQAWVPDQLAQAVDHCINAGKKCTADEVIDL